jgi:flagellar hook-associated protein 3 FlgL
MLSSFYPAVAGRTSDSLSRNRSLFQVQAGRLAVQRLEEQISTGRRISSPSQDPGAAIRTMGIQRDLEFREQAIRNLDSSQSYLNVTEATLANVQDIMTEIRGLGVESAGNLASDEERNGWIAQINASIERLTTAANSRYMERYLFSGGGVGGETVDVLNGLVRFKGNDASLLTIANEGEYVAHNVTGQRALGLISDGIVSNSNLNPEAVPSTRLSDLNQGRGISNGAIVISDGVEKVTVDLANSDTLDDVLQRINDSAPISGREIQATLNNGVLEIDFADGGPGNIRITESSTGTTAADLGILADSPGVGAPKIGGALNPILRPTTRLNQINGGLGFAPTDSLRIQQNGRSYDIAVGNATTIEDLNNKINASGARVLAEITPDGRSFRIRSTESGSNFSIGEGSGGLASQLGLRTFDSQTRLDQLNFNQGVTLADGPDLRITRNDGSEFLVDLNGSITVQDVLDRINNHSDNQNSATQINATLNAAGTGIVLQSAEYVVDPLGPPLTTTPGPITVQNAGGSQAAWDLGLIPKGSTSVTASSIAGQYTLTGTDPNPQEVKGVFNTLVRLKDAIQNNDSAAIGRAVELVDQDLQRLSRTRGSLGVQQQRIDSLKEIQELNKIELKADESRNLDTDLAQAITDLTARQAAYEASLKLLSNSSQLTLFNYL